MKKIAVTGTKGKTTVVRLINIILLHLNYKTLSVDSEYIVLNWEKILDEKYSKTVYGLIPWRCPGRFLHLAYNNQQKKWDCDFAVLECVIWCRTAWLGYASHDIGIFTNVFEDHIGGNGLKNQEDLARAKWSFISRIIDIWESAWTLICNYDDEHIRRLSEEKKEFVKYITTQKEIFDTRDEGVHISNSAIIFKYVLWKEQIIQQFDLKNNLPSFRWKYFPTIWNIAFALYGILFLLGAEKFWELFDEMKEFLDNYTFPLEWGRMVNIERNNRTIIIDYAHEKESLFSLLSFAQTLKIKKDAKLTAVVRLAPDRRDNVYKETWEKISSMADKFIVYDKIDGIERMNYIQRMWFHYHRLPWDVMKMFANALRKENDNIEEVIYRKDAMKKAIEESKEGDVLVIIVNNFEDTAKFLKKNLELNI